LKGAAGSRLDQPAPNVDFALGATSISLRLRPRSSLRLFRVGRSVGWIAHAIEQYATGSRIRPRARYVGVLPAETQRLDDNS
jgi:citrate synthase